MTPDEAHMPPSEHAVELTNEANEHATTNRRRTLAAVAVGVCLTLAGTILVMAVVRSERENAVEDAEQENLRDGWKTLGVVAAQGAQAAEAQPVAAAASAAPVAPSAPPPATTNVVIVNLPAQQQQAPSSGAMVAPAIPNGSVAPPAVQSNSSGASPIYVPVPSLPSGTTSSGVPGQTVGNGSTAGSSPNPALPNVPAGGSQAPALNGTVNASPALPSLPNDTVPAAP